MPVTIHDVARSLNLSHTTVSRVLNDRNTISIPARTRERVRTAAQAMGYSPNRAARALVTGRTYLVALQVFRLGSPYAWMVAQQMQENVIRDGYEVLTREFGGGDLTLQSSVDGILALDTIHPLHNNERPDVPYVLMGRFIPQSLQMAQSLQLDYVYVDLEYGARLATQHLVKAGRKRIAHVTSTSGLREQGTQEEEARCRGYRTVMEDAGLSPEFIVAASDSRQDGCEVLLTYAAEHGIPDALFCRNDELAAGCFRALHFLGRRIPEDTAVIGHDGLQESEYLQPALSTVSPPVEEMCRLAWQFLRARMQDKDAAPQTTILNPSLLLRESA